MEYVYLCVNMYKYGFYIFFFFSYSPSRGFSEGGVGAMVFP